MKNCTAWIALEDLDVTWSKAGKGLSREEAEALGTGNLLTR